MGDLREVRRLVAEVEAPSPEPEPLYPLASSVDASSASAAAAALFPEKGTLRLRRGDILTQMDTLASFSHSCTNS